MEPHYRLHYAPDNASLVIRLALEEMGLPFATVLVDRRRNEQSSPAYRALNPNGLIPVLETQQGPIFETAAILLWLTEANDQMAPAPGTAERAAFLKWLFFASNTLHADLRLLFYPQKYIDPTQAEALRTGIRPRLRRHLALIEAEALKEHSWLRGDQPSVFCYYVACMMRWMALYPAQSDRNWFRLDETPQLQRLLRQLEDRAATHAAMRDEGLGATPFTSPQYAIPPEGSAI